MKVLNDREILCFSSSGRFSLAMLQCLIRLKEKGLHPNNIKIVCGTSGGALIALLVCSGIDYEEFLQSEIGQKSFAIPIITPGFFVNFHNIITKGCYSTLNGFEQYLNESFEYAGLPIDITFAELKERSGKSLLINANDLDNTEFIYFSPWTTPNTRVKDAVMASSAYIPFTCWKDLVLEGETRSRKMVDGGYNIQQLSEVFDPNSPNYLFKHRLCRVKEKEFGIDLDPSNFLVFQLLDTGNPYLEDYPSNRNLSGVPILNMFMKINLMQFMSKAVYTNRRFKDSTIYLFTTFGTISITRGKDSFIKEIFNMADNSLNDSLSVYQESKGKSINNLRVRFPETKI